MASPGQIELREEVVVATAGDQVPVAGAGNLILFPSGGLWYSMDAFGVVTLINSQVANDAITNAKLANMASATFKGQTLGGSGDPVDLTATQAKTALAIASTDVSGLGTAALVNTGTAGANVPTNTQAATLYQGLDTDLTTLAGLTATTDSFIQAKGSAWSARTVAQVKTDLLLTGTNSGDVSLGAVGSTPNVNGASLAGQVLTLQPASTTLAGLMAAVDKKKSDNVVWLAADIGADKTGVTDCTTILNAYLAAAPYGTVVQVEPGTYKINTGGTTISVPRHVRIIGTQRADCIFKTVHATANMFTFTDWYAGIENVTFDSTVGTPRTAGYAVSFGAMNYCYVQACEVYNQWSGIEFTGHLCWLDEINIRNSGDKQQSGTVGAANGAAILRNAAASSANDVFIRRITTDNTSDPTGFAGIRVNQTASLIIISCNIVNAGNALDLVPGAGQVIPSIKVTDTFFDNSTIGVNFGGNASGTIQRAIFVNCWFSSSTNEGVLLNQENSQGVDFIGCEFYQNTHGIRAVAWNDFTVRGSRFAGNTVNGILTTAGAAHSFSVTDNFIGNGSGFGANAQGITVQAGAYLSYQIADNRGLDTNTTKGVSDLGTVTKSYQKSLAANLGATTRGVIASVVTPVATAIATEKEVLVAEIATNSVQAGQYFRFEVTTICAGLNVNTWKAYLNATGLIGGGGQVNVVVTAATVAGGRSTYSGLIKILTIGAPGSANAQGRAITNSAASVAAAAQTTAATAPGDVAVPTTTANWFIVLTLASTVAVSSVVQGAIEAL